MKQNIKISAFAMPVIVAFAYVIWKSCLDWGILLVLLPVGLMTCGIFRASCTIAAVTDHDDGPDTFAPGSMTAAYIYGFELIFPYAWVAACSISGLLPRLTVITFLTIAVAIACASTLKKSVGQGPAIIVDLDVRTLRLQTMFSLLLAVSLGISAAASC